MSQRFLGAVGLSNGDDFRCKTSDGTQGEESPTTNQPSQSHRDTQPDECCNWFGEDPPRNGRIDHISVRQSPHRPTSWPTVGVLPPQTYHSPTNDGEISTRSSLSTGRWGESVDVPSHGYTPAKTCIHNSASPPSLVDEDDEGRTLPLNAISISPMLDGATKLMDQLASPAVESISESSSRSPCSSASLHYFTAASTMSSPTSLDTSATSTDFAAIEDRVRAALMWDRVDGQDLYREEVTRFFANQPVGSDPNGDDLWEEDDSFDELELQLLQAKREEIHARYREELTIRPPENYKYKPIESYFTRGKCAKPAAASTHQCFVGNDGPRDNLLFIQQNGWGGKSRRSLEHLIWVRLFRVRTRLGCWWVGQLQSETICICNRFYLWIRMGTAMQQIALLRRCFYPRRDVIKWISL